MEFYYYDLKSKRTEVFLCTEVDIGVNSITAIDERTNTKISVDIMMALRIKSFT